MFAAFLLSALFADPAAATQPKRETVLEFATCVRRRAPDRVRELLATEPGGEQEQRIMSVIAGAYNACITGRRSLSLQTGMFRGQVAEMALRDEPQMREAAEALPGSPPLKPNVGSLEQQISKLPAERRDGRFIEYFRPVYARCVAGANPRGVAALLPTVPASAEERGAIVAIGETLMQCMPVGVSYRIIASELRPYLMSALYYTAAQARAKG
jgi:hypothetical protein